MDLSKIEKFFTPNMIPERVHIIGCGSVGSTLAELLARYGLTKFTLWDMDIVEPKNIANQMFFHKHIGMKKVDAVADIICMVNPEAKEDIVLQPNGWHGEMVRGYVFLAVDNIEIRKEFVKKNQNNPFVKAVFDIRTGLTDAQNFVADWSNPKRVANLLKSMEFTHEEAVTDTPVSACGIVQGFAPTVRFICTPAVTNFINFATGKGIKKMILADPFNLDSEQIITAM